MKRSSVLDYCFKILFLAVFIFLLSEKRAFAYLDPGSGSMIVQIIIGTIAASAIAIKTFWVKIRSFFGRKNEEKH
jgi:hypothetical protein